MSRKEVLQFLLLTGFLVVLAAGKSISRIERDVASKDSQEDEKKVPFDLFETFNHTFRWQGFNGSWDSDTHIIYNDRNTKDVHEFDVTTLTSRVILDSSVTSIYDGHVVGFSYDKSYVLIGYNATLGFRHSSYRKFVVYDTKRKTYEKIANSAAIPLALWSPNKNALVYVLDNDIYYQVFSDDGVDVRRLTNTGVPGIVYNGVPDWVYEEEVLGTASALWFSPDGRHLAFMTFNDTQVKDVMMFYYGQPGHLDDQYPTETKIKYPKAGSPNPIVSLSVVDLTNPSFKLVNLEPPTDIVGVDNVLLSVNWWNKNRLVATWTNRVQTKGQLVLYDTQGNAENILFEEEKEGWLRLQPIAYHNQYIIILKLQDSGTNAGRFFHATRFEYVEGKLERETDLTPGASEVHSITAIDHARGKLYYLATAVGEPSQRNLYSVPLDGSQTPVCLSCRVRTPEGNHCTYASAAFSTDRSHYVLSCSGPDPMTVTIFDDNNNQLLIWEDNKELRKKLAGRIQPIIKDLSVHVNGYDCKVRLLLPPNFDETKTYPLLIHVYAGPNTVRITDAASYGFHSYLTTNKNIIYGYIDGRGSAYKGSKMLFEIYRRLGTVEVQDQIDVTRELVKAYPWIDAHKVGIWGWSYGGFSTGMALATDTDSVFKCGISVAPVASFIYYDTIYTEVYMGLPTPEDNLEGYDQTDITRKVEAIRNKKFLLIHGSGDDNVHYQHAMALSKALVAKDIIFEQLSYTDEAHALSGVSPHFYHSMDRFWNDCFDLPHTN